MITAKQIDKALENIFSEEVYKGSLAQSKTTEISKAVRNSKECELVIQTFLKKNLFRETLVLAAFTAGIALGLELKEEEEKIQ